MLIVLTEEEMMHREFLMYVTEFIVSEEIMHLFSIEEETNILNSIRTQVIQAGLNYSKETAWEFFMKYFFCLNNQTPYSIYYFQKCEGKY